MPRPSGPRYARYALLNNLAHVALEAGVTVVAIQATVEMRMAMEATVEIR